MLLRWLLAAVHLVALGIGAGAILNRALAFASNLDAAGLERLFAAENRWGLAVVLWIVTGLWRVLAGIEKPAFYYWTSDAFWWKMGLMAAILVLEVGPMTALIRWRIQTRRGEPIDSSRAVLFARVSQIQLWLVVAMVFVATAIVRGLGY